jgi:hypothetical protein
MYENIHFTQNINRCYKNNFFLKKKWTILDLPFVRAVYMTAILESQIRGIMKSRYSERLGRTLGNQYSERELYNIYIYIYI